MRLGTLLAAIVVAPALVFVGGPAQAATTYTVTGFTDPSPTPACAGTVCPSLRAAVDAANQNAGAVIELGSGTYQLSQRALFLAASMRISGAGAASTTIEQTSEFGIIETGEFPDSTMEIQDLTLTGGHAVDTSTPPNIAVGGAIFNGASMTLTRVTLTGNSATGGSDQTPAVGAGAHGGAVWGGAIASSGSLTLVSSTVSNNTTQGGAGQPGDPAGRGGTAVGTIFSAGSLTLIDSTFTNNVVVGGDGGTATSPDGSGGAGGWGLGGAVYANGTVTVRGSTFGGNQLTGGDGSTAEGVSGDGGSALGAAVFSAGATLDVVNSTLIQNVAAAGAGGTAGSALGGAIYAEDEATRTASTSLASDTFSDNSATGSASSTGGNLALEGTGSTMIADSIIEGGASDGPHGNCDLAPGTTVTGSGHNLEDTTPSQCGFSAASSDLIGTSADLGPLANNGGPTQTMLPSTSSPVIGAGGTCTDPTLNPVGPLTVDQRGAPRPAGRPCDIGAVQLPIPLNTKLPSISPAAPAAGHTATCNPGTFIGDGAVTYDYAWTSGGSAVGQNSATYPVTVADIGHSLRCTVVAHGADYSSVPVSSAPRTAIPPTPVLSSLRQSHATWRVPSGLASPVPIGTTFRFTLSEPSTVTLTFTRVISRRLVNGSCVPLTTANSTHPVCSPRYVPTGHIVRTCRAGDNTIGFTGRLSTGVYLRPGQYIVSFSAKNAWGRLSRPATLRFSIVR